MKKAVTEPRKKISNRNSTSSTESRGMNAAKSPDFLGSLNSYPNTKLLIISQSSSASKLIGCINKKAGDKEREHEEIFEDSMPFPDAIQQQIVALHTSLQPHLHFQAYQAMKIPTSMPESKMLQLDYPDQPRSKEEYYTTYALLYCLHKIGVLTSRYFNNMPVKDMNSWILLGENAKEEHGWPSILDKLMHMLLAWKGGFKKGVGETLLSNTARKLEYMDDEDTNNYPMTPIVDSPIEEKLPTIQFGQSPQQEEAMSSMQTPARHKKKRHQKKKSKVRDQVEVQSSSSASSSNIKPKKSMAARVSKADRLSYFNSSEPTGIFLDEFQEVQDPGDGDGSSSSSSDSDSSNGRGKLNGIWKMPTHKGRTKKKKKSRRTAITTMTMQMPTSEEFFFSGGSKATARKWLKKISVFIKYSQVEEPVRFVKQYFGGSAKDWLHTVFRSYNEDPTWHEFVNAFKMHYGEKKKPHLPSFTAFLKTD